MKTYKDCVQFGMQHYNRKFDEGQIREIRARYDLGEFQKPLAREFGTSQQVISKIVNFKAWKHLTQLTQTP